MTNNRKRLRLGAEDLADLVNATGDAGREHARKADKATSVSYKATQWELSDRQYALQARFLKARRTLR